jgi:hypothetical protein
VEESCLILWLPMYCELFPSNWVIGWYGWPLMRAAVWFVGFNPVYKCDVALFSICACGVDVIDDQNVFGICSDSISSMVTSS